MQINLILIKMNASYRDKIMKQSCYFVKICDGEFNTKHTGVNLFSLQLCLHEKMKIAHNLFQDIAGLLFDSFRAIGRSFEKSQKPMIV